MKVHVIDYGASNLGSLQLALQSLGHDCELISTADGIATADTLLFPGVGAFGYATSRLQELQLRDAIVDYAKSGKPFLGICLGMQLMFDRSAEDDFASQGLGLFAGDIIKLQADKIPHMGWNNVEMQVQDSWTQTAESPYAYFVHSYVCSPKEPGIVLATTDYGGGFPSIVQRDNVTAMQFHPEKSGRYGLALLGQWLETSSC